jgi:hypothetical protein
MVYRYKVLNCARIYNSLCYFLCYVYVFVRIVSYMYNSGLMFHGLTQLRCWAYTQYCQLIKYNTDLKSTWVLYIQSSSGNHRLPPIRFGTWAWQSFKQIDFFLTFHIKLNSSPTRQNLRCVAKPSVKLYTNYYVIKRLTQKKNCWNSLNYNRRFIAQLIWMLKNINCLKLIHSPHFSCIKSINQ